MVRYDRIVMALQVQRYSYYNLGLKKLDAIWGSSNLPSRSCTAHFANTWRNTVHVIRRLRQPQDPDAMLLEGPTAHGSSVLLGTNNFL